MKAILIRYLLVLATAGFLAYKFTANHYEAKIANIEAEQAKQAAQVAKSNYDDLRAANSLADVLSHTLANQEQQINTLTLEKTREIKHYATGNVCFKPELTRLLNTPNIDTATGKTASALNAEGAAIATTESQQGEALTDTDIAEWIANAQGLYATCRSRLGGLIDFENGLKD